MSFVGSVPPGGFGVPCVKDSKAARMFARKANADASRARREAAKRMNAEFARLCGLVTELHVDAERARMRVWSRGVVRLIREMKTMMIGL